MKIYKDIAKILREREDFDPEDVLEYIAEAILYIKHDAISLCTVLNKGKGVRTNAGFVTHVTFDDYEVRFIDSGGRWLSVKTFSKDELLDILESINFY